MSRYFKRSILYLASFTVFYNLSEAQNAPGKIDYVPLYDAYSEQTSSPLARTFARHLWRDNYLTAIDTFSFNHTREDTSQPLSRWGIKLDGGFLSRMMGGSVIEIYPSIDVGASLGLSYERTDNPHLGIRSRTHIGVESSQDVNFMIRGTAGSRVAFKAAMGENSAMAGDSFSISYMGEPYEFLQSLTMGGVGVNFTSPFQGVRSEGIGASASMRMGRFWLDLYAMRVKDMALDDSNTYSYDDISQSLTIKSSSYLYKQAFFLSSRYADRYDELMSSFPIVKTDVHITRVDVWVSGGSNQDSQSAYLYDEEDENNIIRVDGMRLLSSTEYTLQEDLGYVILHAPLKDGEVMAVAYSYTMDGGSYTEGELYDSRADASRPIRLKMICPLHLTPEVSQWQLMMKNVYKVGGDKVRLLYDDVKRAIITDKAYDTESANGEYLSYLLGLDRCDEMGEGLEGGDGYIDMVEGLTYYGDVGVMVLPRLMPFNVEEDEISKYDFKELYYHNPSIARKMSDKDRYVIKTEQSINHGTPDNSLSYSNYSFLKPYDGYNTTLLGGELSYRPRNAMKAYISMLSSYSSMGDNEGIISSLSIKKSQIAMGYVFGDKSDFLDGVSRSIIGEKATMPSYVKLGIHGVYEKDKWLYGGSMKRENSMCIDDFDDENKMFSLSAADDWVAASTPMGSPYLNADDSSPVLFNKNRAAITWYVIDPVFYGRDSRTPASVREDESLISAPCSRRVYRREIYPTEDIVDGQKKDMPTLDIYYRPSCRGEYNICYDVIDGDGRIKNSAVENWAGIMRNLPVEDMKGEGIQNISMWIMYPYDEKVDKSREYGYMVIDVGHISEDVYALKEKFDESDTKVLPMEKKETAMGYVPLKTPALRVFSSSRDVMERQDLGLNGIDDETERVKYGVADYYDIESVVGKDPAGDNYVSYMDKCWDKGTVSIPMRYTNYRHSEGNATGNGDFSMRSTGRPDAMDYNADGVLSSLESYSAYRVSLNPDSLLCVGHNHVSAIVTSYITLPDGSSDSVRWIQVRIPLSSAEYSVGGGLDMSGASSMRVWLYGVENELVLRLVEFGLEKGDWELVHKEEKQDNPDVHIERVSVVSASMRKPIPYVMPDGVERERYKVGMTSYSKDEGSMSVVARDLKGGKKAMVYKRGVWNMLLGEDIRAFIHSESLSRVGGGGDVNTVLLLGSDIDKNYYLVKKKCVFTPWGAKSPSDIWPDENKIHITLSLLPKTKYARDKAVRDGTHTSCDVPYAINYGEYVVEVCGNPSISAVRVVGLGVENAGDITTDVCMWFNELRMGRAESVSSYALNAMMSFNLSSLLEVEGEVDYMSSGMNEGLYSMSSWTVDARMQLGKLLPDVARLNIPIEFIATQNIKIHKYLYADYLASKDSAFYPDRDSYMCLNIKDVSRERKIGKKPRLWDVENVSWSFMWDKNEKTDYFKQMNTRENTSLNVDYTYAGESRYMKIKNKWLKYIAPGYLPARLSFGWEARSMSYEYMDRLLSDVGQAPITGMRENHSSYHIALDINPIKMIEMSYSCLGESADYKHMGYEGEERGFFSALIGWNTPKLYSHRLGVKWNIPFHESRYSDWLSMRVGYNASFLWRVGNNSTASEMASHIVQNERLWKVDMKADVSRFLSVWVDKDEKWGVRDILSDFSFSYNRRSSTILPGYTDVSGFAAIRVLNTLGMGFLMGNQVDVLHRAFVEGRLSSSAFSSTNAYATADEKNYSYVINMRPAPYLTLSLKGDKTMKFSRSERFDVERGVNSGDYLLNRWDVRTRGMFSMSTWAFASAFDKVSPSSSATVSRMKTIMPIMAERLTEKYRLEYPLIPQSAPSLPLSHTEVLAYSFLGAYLGGGVDAPLDVLRSFPLPEISLSYEGLGHIPCFKRVFTTARLYSRYVSRYSVGDYMVNDNLDTVSVGYPSQYVLSTIRMSESFSPLLGVEFNLRCGLDVNVEYDRDRMVSLSTASGIVSETIGRNVDIKLICRLWKKWKLSASAALRKNYVSLYNVIDDSSQTSSGERYLSMRLGVDYDLGQNLKIGLNATAVMQSYMLVHIPSRFRSTVAFQVKYDIGR